MFQKRLLKECDISHCDWGCSGLVNIRPTKEKRERVLLLFDRCVLKGEVITLKWSCVVYFWTGLAVELMVGFKHTLFWNVHHLHRHMHCWLCLQWLFIYWDRDFRFVWHLEDTVLNGLTIKWDCDWNATLRDLWTRTNYDKLPCFIQAFFGCCQR